MKEKRKSEKKRKGEKTGNSNLGNRLRELIILSEELDCNSFYRVLFSYVGGLIGLLFILVF